MYYLRGAHAEGEWLPESVAPAYRSRAHTESVDETPLADAFDAHSRDALKAIEDALNSGSSDGGGGGIDGGVGDDKVRGGGGGGGSAADVRPVDQGRLMTLTALQLAPLKIKGLECLERRTKCLGDGPDAAYFAPYVHEDSDEMRLLSLSDEEMHVVSLVDHRRLGAAVYGSIALVRPSRASARTLSKTFMSVRGTRIGVTSLDIPRRSSDLSGGSALLPNAESFAVWVFTRSRWHCDTLAYVRLVDGCSVVNEDDVPIGGHLTYAERVYLNPVTGLGPDWDHLLPARLHHVRLAHGLASHWPGDKTEL